MRKVHRNISKSYCERKYWAVVQQVNPASSISLQGNQDLWQKWFWWPSGRQVSRSCFSVSASPSADVPRSHEEGGGQC
jgi:hypothetical protein